MSSRGVVIALFLLVAACAGTSWKQLAPIRTTQTGLPGRLVLQTEWPRPEKECPVSGPRHEGIVLQILAAFVKSALTPYQHIGEAWLLLDTAQSGSIGPGEAPLSDGFLRVWVDLRTRNGVIITNDQEKRTYKWYCVTVHWKETEPVAVDFELVHESQGD